MPKTLIVVWVSLSGLDIRNADCDAEVLELSEYPDVFVDG